MNEVRSSFEADAFVLTPEHRVGVSPRTTEPLRLLTPAADEGPPEDEADLRTLVAEAVREELRGALGRDVTRAVRRLVRHEVARTLAARDLERR